MNICKIIMGSLAHDWAQQLQNRKNLLNRNNGHGLGWRFVYFLEGRLGDEAATTLFSNAFTITSSQLRLGPHDALVALGDAHIETPFFFEKPIFSKNKPIRERAVICYALAFYQAKKPTDKIAIIDKLLSIDEKILNRFSSKLTSLLQQRRAVLSQAGLASENKPCDRPATPHTTPLHKDLKSELTTRQNQFNNNSPFESDAKNCFEALRTRLNHEESKEMGSHNQALLEKLNIVILANRKMAIDYLTSKSYYSQTVPTELNESQTKALEKWLCIKPNKEATLFSRVTNIKSKCEKLKKYYQGPFWIRAKKRRADDIAGIDEAVRTCFNNKINALLGLCTKKWEQLKDQVDIIEPFCQQMAVIKQQKCCPPLEELVRYSLDFLPTVENTKQHKKDIDEFTQVIQAQKDAIKQCLNIARHNLSSIPTGLENLRLAKEKLDQAKQRLLVHGQDDYMGLPVYPQDNNDDYRSYDKLKQRYRDTSKLLLANEAYNSLICELTGPHNPISIAKVCVHIRVYLKAYNQANVTAGSAKYYLQKTQIAVLNLCFNKLNEDLFSPIVANALACRFVSSDDQSAISRTRAPFIELETTAELHKLDHCNDSDLKTTSKAVLQRHLQLGQLVAVKQCYQQLNSSTPLRLSNEQVTRVCQIIQNYTDMLSLEPTYQDTLEDLLKQNLIKLIKKGFHILNTLLLNETAFKDFSLTYFNALFNETDANESIGTIERYITTLNFLKIHHSTANVLHCNDSALATSYKTLFKSLFQLEGFIQVIRKIKSAPFNLHGLFAGKWDNALNSRTTTTVHRILQTCQDDTRSLDNKMQYINTLLTTRTERGTRFYSCFWKTDPDSIERYKAYLQDTNTETQLTNLLALEPPPPSSASGAASAAAPAAAGFPH